MIRFLSENIGLPAINQALVTDWIRQVAAKYKKKPGEINYMFCNDERILEVNKQFLQHDFYTDIITFDYSSSSIISGDIYISIDTVASNSKTLGISFETELHRVIIHGILHLCGFGDKTPEEEKAMHKREDEALQLLH